MDITYHYPPELFNLLIDTLPRLCRSKKNLLLFFRGAGIRREDLADLEAQVARDRSAVNKFQMTRDVLQQLNERGEAALQERRELLKRVAEFDDFTACWPSDELEAKGLVSEIRRIVNVKDSFTRMRQAKEEERRIHQEERQKVAEAKRLKRERLEEIKRDLCALFASENPRQRGIALEEVMNRLFKEYGISVRDSFCRVGDNSQGIIEQIDGVVNLDGEIYLVEMKWLKNKAGVGDVSQHLVRVFNRGSKRGIFISASEYTEAAIQTCQESLSQAVVILCSVEEIVFLLERSGDFKDFIREKIQIAIAEKKPYMRILE